MLRLDEKHAADQDFENVVELLNTTNLLLCVYRRRNEIVQMIQRRKFLTYEKADIIFFQFVQTNFQEHLEWKGPGESDCAHGSVVGLLNELAQ